MKLKVKVKDGKTVQKEDVKSHSDKKLKILKSKENSDRVKGGHESPNKKMKNNKTNSSKKHSSPKDGGVRDDGLLLYKDEKNVIMVSYDDDDTSGDDNMPLKPKKAKKHVNKGLDGTDKTTKLDKSYNTQKQNDEKDTILPDFEGFSNTEKDTRLADFLATAQRVPDEMDLEYSEWFDENDLHMVVSGE